MRFKYLKYLAFALGGLSTVVASGALYLHASFDGARLAAELSSHTKQHYQRTLRFEGPLELAMFPRLELRLPPTSLSGRNGDGEFLGVEQAAIGVRLLPLLAQRVVVERVQLDGLRLALLRTKDGKLNAADLLAPLHADAPLDFDVDRLGVSRGALTWIDEANNGRSFALSSLELGTGRLARSADGQLELAARLTQAAPDIDARVELQTSYHIEPDVAPLVRKLQLTATGELAGRPGTELEFALAELRLGSDTPPRITGLDLRARGKTADGTIELHTTAPELVLTPGGAEAASAEASLRLNGKARNSHLHARLTGLHGQGKNLSVDTLATELDWNAAAGRIKGKLDSPARWQGDTRLLDVPGLTGELDFTPTHAAAPVKIAVQASGRVDFARDSATGKLDLRADDSHIQGTWNLPRLSPPALGFDVDVDRLDLDRYLAEAGKRPPKTGKDATPLDLTALKGHDIDAVLRIASLRAGGLQLEQLRLPVSLHNGKLVSTGHSLALYGGALEGTFSLAADGNAMSYRGYLQNASLAPLMRAATGAEPLTGNLNFFAELSSTGATPDALRSGLKGLARLRLKNGSLRGIDATAALKDWRSAIQARQSARRPSRPTETTPLGELTASFQISDGVARSSDLMNQGSPIGLTGSGEFNVTTGHLDAITRVSLLALPPGADGALLASLRGVAVPVRVKATPAGAEWLLEPGATLPAAVRPATPPPVLKPAPKPVAKPVRPTPAKPAATAPAPAPAPEAAE
ncbi:AsmA family protein [Zoogloea sp.]|uniref:AsmA family protein n=1 Tax=Zoogloea sp. TaxID=49181 RepID=UPI00262747D7|nr:AsmA family protein [Zoogloea sp.]